MITETRHVETRHVETQSETGRLVPILAVLTLGLGLLFVSGIAQATVLHDAAHDQRHAMAFPCH